MELAYQLWKPAAEETPNKIVLLHGMGGTGALWRPIGSALEDDFQVLAPDQRGHGKSQVPHIPGARTEPTYTPLDYGQDVVETMEALSFKPTWVVGHSMGVRTACAVAHLQPTWVQGLVLIDLGLSGVAGGGLGEGLARFLKTLPMEFPNRAAARTFIEQNCPDPSIGQYLMAVSTQGLQGKLTFPFDQSALIQTIHAARDVSVRTWLKALAAQGLPILALRGANSLVWSHAEFEYEKSQFAEFADVRFEEFPNAGHGLPFEQRIAFIKRLREFIGIPAK
jgi:esterase